ncbi:MAG: urea amidolyase associated protein UAAP1 [Ilumatobacteraceae bacterium]
MTAPSTSSLHGARDHARSQAGAAAPTGRTIPPPEGTLWDETVGVGGYAGRRLPRGTVLRIADDGGDACVHLVVFNAASPDERINVADTVKVQWQAYLGPGALLLSDMGRVLMSIVDDTSARHDALCGAAPAAVTAARYGDGAIGSSTPSARELLVVAAAKFGLQRRDVPTGVNLFKRVAVAADGSLSFDGTPRPGVAVELRAEMDVVVLLANVPHPLDPRPEYAGSTVRCSAAAAERPDDDPLRTSTPERQRAFENTDDLLAGAR